MNDKNGIGFAFIISIILLLVSGGVILAAIKKSASKVDEKLQVTLCRQSNEIKFWVEEKTKGVISGQEICNTINKHSVEKTLVPTQDYKQDKEGAESEIRDMIKNCWYMWLEGSETNTFRKYPFSKGCFTCYTFKIKDDAKGITYKTLEASMEESYFAEDRSDKCAPGGGGIWKDRCEKNEKTVQTKKTPESPNKVCCVKDILNECENKGGKCSSTGKPEGYSLYNEWSCPLKKESCYVKESNVYSYTKYIREFGSKGGDMVFISPNDKQTGDISYVPGEIYAISFVSPSEQFCATEEGKDLKESIICGAKIGGYVLVIGGAAYIFAAVPAAGAAVGTAAQKILKGVSFTGAVKTGTAAYALNEIGLLDLFSRKGVEIVTSGLTVEVPNLIVVSTLEHAQQE
ncbi:hypothetical protein HYX01_02720, partial [Candidatus Woesearchaeota archaeon]|nr:hypothetical protein [Candidatus Woesearchaeota archaeon]